MNPKYTKTWTTAEGVHLHAFIAPCSWMYGGLQIHVNIQPSSEVTNTSFVGFSVRHPQSRLLHTYTESEFDGLIAGCEQFLVGCSECGAPAWNHISTNRAGKCEACFMRALRAEFEEESAKERAAQKRLDAKMKKKGFTHKAVAWVHPPTGDDYQIEMYSIGPFTAGYIAGVLKRKQSRILDDVQEVEL